MPEHLIDPNLGNSQPNFRGMGLTGAEQRALEANTDPNAVTDEFRAQEARESSAMERYEMERMQRESDQLRAELGQSRDALAQVQASQANVQGQLTVMQQAQLAQAQQAAIDNQFQLSADEQENYGEMLPAIEKVVGRTAAQIRSELTAEYEAKLAQVQQDTAAPLQTEIQELRQQTQTQQAQHQQRLAAEINREIADMGMGDINTVASHPDFQRWQATPVYEGATVARADELARHVKEGNTASAIAMLRSFRDSSEAFAPREDNVVPTSRKAAPVQPLSSAQTQNLNKRDQLLAKYAENMDQANEGRFPPGIENRAQYKVHQAEIQKQIDAIPTV